MAENDAANGNTEAASDLDKKIIKQVEVTLAVFVIYSISYSHDLAFDNFAAN